MKTKIIALFIVLSTALNVSAQYNNVNEANRKVIEQLNVSLKSANTLIVTGAVISGVGIAATIVAIKNYTSESKKIKTVDYGQLPGIMDNQVQMNKTIPTAIMGLGGLVLTGIGTNILVKGIIKSNDIKVQLVAHESSVGLGLSLKF